MGCSGVVRDLQRSHVEAQVLLTALKGRRYEKHQGRLAWKRKRMEVRGDGLVYIFIYNDKFIMANFPKLRMNERKDKTIVGKYHFQGIGGLGKNSQFSVVNQK